MTNPTAVESPGDETHVNGAGAQVSGGATDSITQQNTALQNASAPENTSGDNSNPSLPSLGSVSANLHSRVSLFLSENHPENSILHKVQNQTRISLSIFQEAFERYTLKELSLSYNGGKDCLVLLVLFLASLHTLRSNNNSEAGAELESIPAIYAQPPHPFRSVEEFVLTSSKLYHLSLTRYTTDPPHTTLRSAFASYLDLHPNVRAIFVGTRRTDPHGANLKHFDPTNSGWPSFVRINPIIDWHYAEIWAFIRHIGVDYCSLYDEGYTSLGGTNDTHPNPKLKQSQQDPKKGSNGNIYRPAYELMDDQEERLGRD